MKLVIEIDPRNDYEIIDAIETLKSLPTYRDHEDDRRVPDLLEGTNGERLRAAVARATEDVPPVPIDVAIEQAHAEAKPASETDAIAALQEFVKAQGVPAAVALLTEFGVARVTELQPEQRSKFIERVKSTGTTGEQQ